MVKAHLVTQNDLLCLVGSDIHTYMSSPPTSGPHMLEPTRTAVRTVMYKENTSSQDSRVPDAAVRHLGRLPERLLGCLIGIRWGICPGLWRGYLQPDVRNRTVKLANGKTR